MNREGAAEPSGVHGALPTCSAGLLAWRRALGLGVGARPPVSQEQQC